MPLTSAMAASFVVYPPPSHILRQDILRARKRDPPPWERTDRRTGTTRPSLARAGRHVSKNPVALFGNRIGPGFPRPLSRHTQNKQSLLTGREVRDAQRRRPLCLEGSSSCVARYPPKAGTRADRGGGKTKSGRVNRVSHTARSHQAPCRAATPSPPPRTTVTRWP